MPFSLLYIFINFLNGTLLLGARHWQLQLDFRGQLGNGKAIGATMFDI
jgi:hypothetical protein